MNDNLYISPKQGTLDVAAIRAKLTSMPDVLLEALRNAGFSDVRLGGTFTAGGRMLPLPSEPTGPGVIISAVR